MANVKIVTDSCSDLGKDIREKYDIEYVRMNTVYKDEETPASLDWEYYSPKELYDIMRNGERVLTTQVPPEEFKNVFTKFLEEGNDIVYIGGKRWCHKVHRCDRNSGDKAILCRFQQH